MKYVKLGIGGAQASVLGFGCAAVMGRSGRSQSLHALHSAYDMGINFYDTARSYGYGESESIVGEFLRGRRDRVILSSKFGIVPKKQQTWKRALMPALRTFLDVAPSARNLVRSQVKAQLKENQLTVKVLRESLEESLRKLRTDYIDILFMHAAPESALLQFDVLDELEKLIMSGKIRMAGISADPEVIKVALEAKIPVLHAMQFPVNLFDLRMMRIISAARAKGLLFVANHPFGGVDGVNESKARLCKLADLPTIPSGLRNKLLMSDDGMLSEVILNLILAGTGIQIALPSMMNLGHLRTNIKSISDSRFTTEELNWIRFQFAENTNLSELPTTQKISLRAGS
jgi:aryl-alcohol dehydrogenase-like predicted oxidoreductase